MFRGREFGHNGIDEGLRVVSYLNFPSSLKPPANFQCFDAECGGVMETKMETMKDLAMYGILLELNQPPSSLRSLSPSFPSSLSSPGYHQDPLRSGERIQSVLSRLLHPARRERRH